MIQYIETLNSILQSLESIDIITDRPVVIPLSLTFARLSCQHTRIRMLIKLNKHRLYSRITIIRADAGDCSVCRHSLLFAFILVIFHIYNVCHGQEERYSL